MREFAERYVAIGLRVAYYRKLVGLTQEELAERIDRSAAYIGHIEAPGMTKGVSLDILFRIADTLNVEAYKFLIID